MRSIIILDMSYTLRMFRDLQLTEALESRKISGYFSKVISVHPLAGLFLSENEKYGQPKITELDSDHIFIEGKVGKYRLFKYLFPINFILSQLDLIKCVVRLARGNKVEIIRIGDPYYLGILGIIFKWFLTVPLVIRVCFRYDEIVRATGRPVMPRLFLFRFIEKFTENIVFKKCDLVAGANEDNMLYALENGANKNTSTVFRYGNLIHKDHWVEPNERRNCDDVLSLLCLQSVPFIITIARLDPMKYVEHTVLALSELIRRGHLVKAVIVGDGISRGSIENLANNLGVSSSLILCGNQNQRWIAEILPRASMVISPHMGRALTEAALAGVPIVAYDYDWQREIVVDGVTGYLVNHKDWHSLADKAELLLINRGLAREMGKNVRLKVMDMMDPMKLERHEILQYEKLFMNK